MTNKTGSGDTVTAGADDDEARAPNTTLNALIGAAVSVVLGFVPFSPILGGAVAGYLEGGDLRDGASVGAISGVLAAIPPIVVFALLSVVLVFGPEGGIWGVVLIILAIVLAVVTYTVGLSILGGAISVYLVKEL